VEGVGMKKFEYKFVIDGEDETEKSLNLLGNNGWELVTISPCGKDNSYLGFWFKRPLE
jgi:hypothetical protein